MHCERTINRDYVTLLKIKVMKKFSKSSELKRQRFMSAMQSISTLRVDSYDSDILTYAVKIFPKHSIFTQSQIEFIISFIPKGFHFYITIDSLSDVLCFIIYADSLC